MAGDKTHSKSVCKPDGEEGLEQKLALIEHAVKNIDHIRKRQFMVTLLGIVVILLVMAVFVGSLADFVYNYKSQLLLEEIGRTSTIVTRSPELHALVRDFNNIFVPAYKRELAVALEAAIPDLRKDVYSSIKELSEFLEKDIRLKMIERITSAIEKLETNFRARHPELSVEVLDQAFAGLNEHFVEEFSTILAKRLDDAKDHLVLLDNSFKQYKNTPEYVALSGIDPGEIENRLLESFLELWIYQLNPEKGAMPAERGQK